MLDDQENPNFLYKKLIKVGGYYKGQKWKMKISKKGGDLLPYLTPITIKNS